MLKNFENIFYLFEKKQKKYFYFIIFTLFITAILETISISAFLPLLTSLFGVQKKYDLELLNNFISSSEINLNFNIVLFFFTLIYLIKFIFLLFCNWFNKTFEMEIGKYFTNKLYNKYINLDYQNFFEKNSSIMLKNITSEVRVLIGSVSALIFLITEFIVLFFIISFLLIINFETTIKILIFLGIFAYLIGVIFKSKLTKWGKLSQLNEGYRSKNFIESFSAIKEIKIFRKEVFFSNRLANYNSIFFNSNKKHRFIRVLPKLLLEMFLIFSVILFLFIQNINVSNLLEAIPLLVVYLAAGVRVLPSINIIISQSQYLNFSKPVVDNLQKEFNEKNIFFKQSNKKNKFKINLKRNIQLKNIFFKYNANKNFIFSNLNLNIKKNQCIGIIGQSGSGKSTLINLIIGLLNPSKGSILVDNKMINKKKLFWSKNLIGYIPQQTFLFDDTIKNNIAFGQDDSSIDNQYINELIDFVELRDLVNRYKFGIETLIGEKGVKLSGGQIQRIGIARALYIKPSILIFDESTNALDYKTEEKIFKNLKKIKKNFTIIIVAHRKSSLVLCDRIYEVKNRNIELK